MRRSPLLLRDAPVDTWRKEGMVVGHPVCQPPKAFQMVQVPTHLTTLNLLIILTYKLSE